MVEKSSIVRKKGLHGKGKKPQEKKLFIKSKPDKEQSRPL
jgi:hypothetical protein